MEDIFKRRLTAGLAAVAICLAPVSPAIASRILIPLSASNSLLIVDDRQQKPTETVSGLENIDGVATDGKTTVILTSHSNDLPETAMISYFNVTERQIIWSLPLPERSGHTAVASNGTFAAMTQPDLQQVIIVDLHARKVKRRITLDSTPDAVLFSPDSKVVYVTTSGGTGLKVLSVASAKGDRVVSGLSVVGHLALDPSAAHLYADSSEPGKVLDINPSDMSLLRTITLGGELHGVAVSGKGDYLYAADFGNNRIVSYNLTSGQELSALLEPAPYHISVVHDTSQLLVTSADDGILWSISSGTLGRIGTYRLGSVVNEIGEIEADEK